MGNSNYKNKTFDDLNNIAIPPPPAFRTLHADIRHILQARGPKTRSKLEHELQTTKPIMEPPPRPVRLLPEESSEDEEEEEGDEEAEESAEDSASVDTGSMDSAAGEVRVCDCLPALPMHPPVLLLSFPCPPPLFLCCCFRLIVYCRYPHALPIS